MLVPELPLRLAPTPQLKTYKRPYPCIRLGRFLDMTIADSDVYPEVLERTKRGDKFLDLGCCFGQEIRKLVFDGAPSVNTYGSDLWADFFTVGYELFRDEGRLKTTFIAADVFDDASPLVTLAGQINVVFTGSLFHLFSLEEQEKVALRVIQLLAAQPGSLLIGRQSGSEEAGEIARSGDTSGRKHFRHNPQSWKSLWERVGRKTGSRWSVKADLRFQEPELVLAAPAGLSVELQKAMSAQLVYSVRRL